MMDKMRQTPIRMQRHAQSCTRHLPVVDRHRQALSHLAGYDGLPEDFHHMARLQTGGMLNLLPT